MASSVCLIADNEIMGVSLNSAVSSVVTNRRRASALKALGIMTIGDALTYYPFRVTDPVPIQPIRRASLDGPVAFAATVRSVQTMPMMARRGMRVEAVVSDRISASARDVESSLASLVFFSYNRHYADWVASRLREGATVVVSGEPGIYRSRLQFTHPQVIVVGRDAPTTQQALALASKPQPVYHASSRISSRHIHESILTMLHALEPIGSGHPAHAGTQADEAQAAAAAEQSESGGSPIDVAALRDAVPDILPSSVLADKGLMHRADAVVAIHSPDSIEDFHRALYTMRYEEAFVTQTALLRVRREAHDITSYACLPPKTLADTSDVDSTARPLTRRFIESLPFSLTRGQLDVIDAIAADMARVHPMQRLLQGEVGSGKTVVAAVAMLRAVDAGHQAVLVAPTQVLAEQHYATIGAMLARMKENSLPLILLTGGMRLAPRRRALGMVASGRPCLIIATHAAFSKHFQAPNLALVVIDEQHRFGVEQRQALLHQSAVSPHMLVMTATPIPRTAALTWFGDLDVSVLSELPGGRKPIRTVVVPEASSATMARMFAHIRTRVDAGERAYVVCPRIDPAVDAQDGSESEDSKDEFIDDPLIEDGEETRPPLHSVAEIARRLSALPQFRGVRIATLTGRDEDEVKRRVMMDFSSGAAPVLVATTVIEVGVDVPQASCIVVFDADRYGLSQLHQLRGRVGRGGTKSWAFFVSRADAGSLAAQRLEVIRASTDGAVIAQADLELRGAGDVLGDTQSGRRSSLKLLRVIKDAKIIEEARGYAARLLEADSELHDHVQLAGAVLDFTRGNEEFLTST